MKHDRSNKGSAAAFEKGCVRDTVKVSHGHWQRQQSSGRRVVVVRAPYQRRKQELVIIGLSNSLLRRFRRSRSKRLRDSILNLIQPAAQLNIEIGTDNDNSPAAVFVRWLYRRRKQQLNGKKHARQ